MCRQVGKLQLAKTHFITTGAVKVEPCVPVAEMNSEDGMKQGPVPLEQGVGNLVMPGDQFSYPHPADQVKLVLGPGLKLIPVRGEGIKDEGTSSGRIVACRAGILTRVKGNTFFIEHKAKQYDVYKKDDVLGIIKQKGKGDQYNCDVGSKERAYLSKFAFEGATKRFRPDLQVGDVVYGKVVDLPSDFPMEITCVHSSGKALGLGSLEGGHIFQVPVHFTRVLRTSTDAANLLKKIGSIVPCETAVGANGLVWIKAKNAVLTLLVSQFVVQLSKAEQSEYESLIKQFRKGITNLPT